MFLFRNMDKIEFNHNLFQQNNLTTSRIVSTINSITTEHATASTIIIELDQDKNVYTLN
jgi:hypothetical protein